MGILNCKGEKKCMYNNYLTMSVVYGVMVLIAVDATIVARSEDRIRFIFNLLSELNDLLIHLKRERYSMYCML